MAYDPREQQAILSTFGLMLAGATSDGGKKRARGEKPPWWRDSSHEAAIFSHLNKWKHGERRDPDSGAHPLVHLAWRALAIAWVETHGEVPPPLVDRVPPASAVDQESGREYHEQGRPVRPWPGGANVPGHPDYLGASDPCGRPDCEEVIVGSRTAGRSDPSKLLVHTAWAAREADRVRGRR